MSRPFPEERLELERLESVAALLTSAMQASGVLAVRLRQAERRAPGLLDVIQPAHLELGRVVEDCDKAWELLKLVLADRQRRRMGDNQNEDTA